MKTSNTYQTRTSVIALASCLVALLRVNVCLESTNYELVLRDATELDRAVLLYPLQLLLDGKSGPDQKTKERWTYCDLDQQAQICWEVQPELLSGFITAHESSHGVGADKLSVGSLVLVERDTTLVITLAQR